LQWSISEIKNHAWTHHQSEKIKNACVGRKGEYIENNLPIEQGVMNSHDRFYTAFVTSFTKAEHTSSLFDKSARKLSR
jgi:hypothetical protein